MSANKDNKRVLLLNSNKNNVYNNSSSNKLIKIIIYTETLLLSFFVSNIINTLLLWTERFRIFTLVPGDEYKEAKVCMSSILSSEVPVSIGEMTTDRDSNAYKRARDAKLQNGKNG